MDDVITLTLHGPLFDGSGVKLLDTFMVQATDAVAQQGVNDIHERLDSVLQHPTGTYERSIRTERQKDSVSVNDSGIIYGPWLEGVGSRNKATRFKGYNTFREVSQALNKKTKSLVERELDRVVARLN